MFHELTEKIRQRDIKSDRWDDVDSIIRTYLGEKAKEIKSGCRFGTDADSVDQILGLSPSNGVGETECGCHCRNWPDAEKICGCFCHSTKPKDSEVWCQHCMTSRNDLTTFKMVEGYIGWKFCPICGTPRPKAKTLAEKFRAVLADTYAHNAEWYAKELADIAQQHFSQEKV